VHRPAGGEAGAGGGQRPIAAALLAVAAFYLLLPLVTWAWRRLRVVVAAQG
jgi:hypothetical protein